jgi:hypothetical protein
MTKILVEKMFWIFSMIQLFFQSRDMDVTWYLREDPLRAIIKTFLAKVQTRPTGNIWHLHI